MTTLVFALIAYLIGSVSFAVVTSKMLGLADPRTYGSGNPGATNVLRSGSKLAALLTLVGDGAKGSLAVWLAQRYAPAFGAGAEAVAAATLAVFLGHVFPLFLRFKGGKGVATAAGVLLALAPLVGLAALLVWIFVAVSTRYSSLAGLVAAVLAPFVLVIGTSLPAPIVAAVVAMSALLIWRHADNIRRLVSGTEGRIGQNKPG